MTQKYERPRPVEEDEEVIVDQEVGHVLRIGTYISPEIREELLQTLKDFKPSLATQPPTCKDWTPTLHRMS